MMRQIKDISELKPGIVIRHKGHGRQFVVTNNFGSRATAVTSADITNLSEWEIVEAPDVIPMGKCGDCRCYSFRHMCCYKHREGRNPTDLACEDFEGVK